VDSFVLANIVILLVLIALTGLFSVSESALMALGRLRLAHAIEMGGKRGQALEAWRRDPNRLLTTILILNNVINITASTVAAFLAVHLSESWGFNRAQVGVGVAAVVTVVIIVFGEVAPKLLAIRQAEPIALFIIRPLVTIDRLLAPLGRVVVALANVFLRALGQKPGTHVPVVTEEEIHSLIDMGADAGIIEDQEHKMLSGVISLGDMEVREVMVPRTGMDCINAAESIARIINQIVQTGYSRMPVYKDTVDNIVGVVYAKDLIPLIQNSELIVLHDILRAPYFVPKTKKVSDLLREFQKGKIHMAIVVDEYGGTSGLVTLEDLIEVIVGEIHDEYDVEENPVDRVSENSWVASGQADIADINAALDAELPNHKDLNTIGGFLSDLMGHLPRKGEVIQYEDLHFTIAAASNRKIEKIYIRRVPPPVEETQDKENS
jgi:CBS domain containing-hemolysin-like protein